MDQSNQGTSYRWVALFVASMGALVAGLDIGMVNISLPVLKEVFGASPEAVVWVWLVYSLLGGSLLVTWGRLGDMKGQERIFQFGFPVATAGLVLCSLAPNLVTLVIFRMIEVTGLSILVSLAPALSSAYFPARERGKALGIYFAVFGVGAFVGPVLGGFLLDYLWWQAIFLVQLPVAAAGSVLAFVLLKRGPMPAAGRKFDLAGALVLLAALASLILSVNQVRILGWSSPFVLGLGAAAIILFVLFVVMEMRIAQPVLDLRLFKNRVFGMATLSSWLIFIAQFGFMLVMPFYIIDGLGRSPTTAGVVAMVYLGLSTAMFPVTGWLGDKLGPNVLCPLGLAIIAVGFFLVSGLGLDSSMADIMVRIVIYAVGWGIFLIPNSSAIMGAVPLEKYGIASAMMITGRQMGMAIGSAVGMTLYAAIKFSKSASLVGEQGQAAADRAGVAAGMQNVMLAATGFAVLALVVSLLMRKRPQPREKG